MRTSKIYDAADGSATPGRVFTASINQETIVPNGEALLMMKMGLKGAVSTAAVVIEDFADLLSEYVFRVGAEERIVMDAQDLCALMAFYYNELPTIGENTDATGNDFLGGIKIPVYEKADAAKPFTHSAERTAVTNIATETLALTGYWAGLPAGKLPIHARKISHTTAGSAGLETLDFRIVPKGRMIGLIIEQPNGFADGNIDTSIQRVKLLVNGEQHSHFNTLSDFTSPATIDFVTPSPMADLLRPYIVLDLRPDGLDVKGQEVTIQLDVQDVSDAVSIIPVIEVQ